MEITDLLNGLIYYYYCMQCEAQQALRVGIFIFFNRVLDSSPPRGQLA